MGNDVIATRELRKTYGTTEAVCGVNLSVPKGAVCGFLGRNGAGKTTTMKMLVGMTRPTGGSAQVFGLDATDASSSVEIRTRTAFVDDEKHLYDGMTVGEIIRFTASFFPQWRSDLEERYVRGFGLPRHRGVKALSRGMRTKLAMLLALCRNAELLMLDEPTSGLDPAAAEELLQAIVAQVAHAETTVFFSSHQIAEVEQIADAIAIIDRGRIVVNDTIDGVRERFRRIQLVFDGNAPHHTFTAPGITRVGRSGRVMTLVAGGDIERIVMEARALTPLSVDVSPLTLKDIFLESVVTETES